MDQEDAQPAAPQPAKEQQAAAEHPPEATTPAPAQATQQQPVAQNNDAAAQAEKKPKVVSVSQAQAPISPPVLSRPRVLSQVAGQPVQATIPNVARPPVSVQGPAAAQASPSPKSDAEWAERAITVAERDAEEHRMAQDVTSLYRAPKKDAPVQTDGQQDAPKTSKSEPKSVSGLLYAIKGFADSVSRKLAGK